MWHLIAFPCQGDRGWLSSGSSASPCHGAFDLENFRSRRRTLDSRHSPATMDLITSPTRHAVPFLSNYGKYCNPSPSSSTASIPDPRHHNLLSRPQQQLRPSPRSFNTYSNVDQAASRWTNAYHPIITNLPYPSGAEHPEHSLRRKTPNGTIDNGYDGTPTQLACGPPAQKYLNMTPTAELFPSSGRSIQYPTTPTWYSVSQPPRASCDDTGSRHMLTPVGGAFGQGTMGFSPAAYGPSLASPSMHSHAMSLGFPMRNNTFASSYHNQNLTSPSVHSPASFNSANPIWNDGSINGYHHGMQMSTGYPPHNIPYESGFVAVQAPLPQLAFGGHGYGQNPPFHMPYMLDDGFPRHHFPAMHQSSQHLQNLSLGSGSANQGNGSPQTFREPKSFREGVLVDAHKAYTELVTQISRTKKVSHGRSSSRSMKTLIFPKAPKHLVSRPSSHLQRAHQSFPGAIPTYQQRQIAPTLNSANLVSKMARESGMLPSAQLDATGRALGGYPVVTGTIYGNIIAQTDYAENARTWFRMLENLCKQDWKWLDGMLMGGCLLYSLERYEEALFWFRRILELDAK